MYVIKSNNKFAHVIPSGIIFLKRKNCKVWGSKQSVEDFVDNYKNHLPKQVEIKKI